ncbi:class I SAM-dependent methyltransferase [Amycolatopsis halotolerans]|uniref:Class I SAM-dependent methyltransferase n=1 Tax=Amycolatopsis halotolerans TaxID=330083 RepID=A0ABV7QKK5_9PSEU
MLVTLFLRALDARDPQPILGDRLAAEAVERIDYDWAKLDKPSIVRGRAGVALRARQFDTWAADFLREHPEATVLQMACGMDSRAFRLDPPGVRWFDVDLPDVIALRRKLYSDGGSYRMIAASVTDSAWLEEIPADRPALILAEGLLMYLREAEVSQLLRRLTGHFPSGALIFDGVSVSTARATQLLKKVLPPRWYPYPAYWTAIRDESDIPRWNPDLRPRGSEAVLKAYGQIPDPRVRRCYRLASRFRWTGDFLRVFRAEF